MMANYPYLYSPYWPVMWGAIIPLIAVLAVWSLVAKGYALWVSARSGQKWWFIVMLIVNTVGILEVIYLLFFSPLGSNRFHMKKTSVDESSADEKK